MFYVVILFTSHLDPLYLQIYIDMFFIGALLLCQGTTEIWFTFTGNCEHFSKSVTKTFHPQATKARMIHQRSNSGIRD